MNLKYISDVRYEIGENLHFRDDGLPSPKSKTHKFAVISNYNKAMLGYVKWYSPWRKYCFMPLDTTIFDNKCLAEISEYCAYKTKNHYMKVRAK